MRETRELGETGGHDPGPRDLTCMSTGHRIALTVGELLRQRQESLALAESCTGGLIAAAMTTVAGSSDYLWGSAVVYSAEAKQAMLGLDDAILDEYGTVSGETTAALAAEVKRLSGVTFGLAVTGWAGPEGGNDADPVGTVYLALASPEGSETRRFSFAGDREAVREQALVSALEWLQDKLSERNRVEDGPAG
jgi:PncC family amidohydrolase